MDISVGERGMKSIVWMGRMLLAAALMGPLAAWLAPTAQAEPTADPGKVLRYVFPAAETGFDPAVVSDLYSTQVVQSVFESLYTYDYLAQTARPIPSI
jgi:ABC-type oligopeptide transport system substrate-binding subunit